ncbi:MAG TPA: zinc-ribbon domain-containing protein [Polyangia bacterium]
MPEFGDGDGGSGDSDPSTRDGARVLGVSPESVKSSPLVPRDNGRAIGVSFVRFTPRTPHDPRALLWNKRSPSGAAAFRHLRQQLIAGNDPRTILCTSANPGEGKTTLATNLALAYAEIGRPRVLLIEGSLRAAALSEVFGFKPPIGFGAQLVRHRSLPDERWVVVQVGTQPLFVMAAEPHRCPQCGAALPEDARFCGRCGTTVGHVAADTLDSAGFVPAVRRFRETFDYLVIDGPPVLARGGIDDVKDVADAVVLAALKGHSRRRDLRGTAEQISPKPIAAVALLDG